MKKFSRFFIITIAVMSFFITANANAALKDGEGLFLKDYATGIGTSVDSVEFVDGAAYMDLNSSDLKPYLPDTESGWNSMWSTPWTDTWGNSHYYSGFNPTDYSFYFLDSNYHPSSSAIFSQYDWSNVNSIQSNITALGLDWLTVGTVTFDNEYNSFTTAGYSWLGSGTAIEAFRGQFTRAPVPVPGALLLLGSGFFTLVGINRKRNK